MKIRAFERRFVNLSRDCRCLCKQRTVCLGSNFSTLTTLANHMAYQPSSDPEQETPPILQHLSSSPWPRGCRCLFVFVLSESSGDPVSPTGRLGPAAGRVGDGKHEQSQRAGQEWKTPITQALRVCPIIKEPSAKLIISGLDPGKIWH